MAKTKKTVNSKAKKTTKVASKKGAAKKSVKAKSKDKAKKVTAKAKSKAKKATAKKTTQAKSKVSGKKVTTKITVKAKSKASAKKATAKITAKAKSKASGKKVTAKKTAKAKSKTSAKNAIVKTKVKSKAIAKTKSQTKPKKISAVKTPQKPATQKTKGTTKAVARQTIMGHAEMQSVQSIKGHIEKHKIIPKSSQKMINQFANKESNIAMETVDEEVVVKPKRVQHPKKAIELIQGDDVKAVTHVIAGELEIAPYQPSIDEEYMSEGQKAHFTEILNAMKQQLMEDVDRTVTNMRDDDKNLSDFTDRATKEEEINFMLRTRNREGKLLKKIEDAIDRIKHDEFGFCESCGVEIGIRRLEARPTATLCIDCKTLDEIKEKQRST